jgi:hypothetical protein
MGILDRYREELAKDKESVNNDFPKDNSLSEDKRSEYEEKLTELRNNPTDMENAYKRKMSEMRQLEEWEMEGQDLIKEEEVDKVVVRHAYCEDCGEELISKVPPMFNPFTMERVCKHTCSKCGKIYNLEYSYPRLAFYNKDREELPAFTR